LLWSDDKRAPRISAADDDQGRSAYGLIARKLLDLLVDDVAILETKYKDAA
jgi:hypothetical protein